MVKITPSILLANLARSEGDTWAAGDAAAEVMGTEEGDAPARKLVEPNSRSSQGDGEF